MGWWEGSERGSDHFAVKSYVGSARARTRRAVWSKQEPGTRLRSFWQSQLIFYDPKQSTPQMQQMGQQQMPPRQQLSLTHAIQQMRQMQQLTLTQALSQQTDMQQLILTLTRLLQTMMQHLTPKLRIGRHCPQTVGRH